MAVERDWRDERAREAEREERPHRRKRGRKPFALRVTTTYRGTWLGDKTFVWVHRYETERARRDAETAFSRRKPFAWEDTITVEKIDD